MGMIQQRGGDIQGNVKDASEVLTCTLKHGHVNSHCGHGLPCWAGTEAARRCGPQPRAIGMVSSLGSTIQGTRDSGRAQSTADAAGKSRRCLM